MSATDPVLAIEHLSVAFAPASGPALALADVSLRIDAGEIVGLVGEERLRQEPDQPGGHGPAARGRAVLAGRIALRGTDLLTLRERQLRQIRGRRIGMVFQEPMVALNPLMRVGRQIAEVLTIHGIG